MPDTPCNGLCCPDADRCADRELVAAQIRAMQAAIAPSLLSETEALAALVVAGPHMKLGAYNRMRAAQAALPVLYIVTGPEARVQCLAETDAMLQAAYRIREQFHAAETARMASALVSMLRGV